MRRTLTVALLAALALAAAVPVSLVATGKAAADVHQQGQRTRSGWISRAM